MRKLKIYLDTSVISYLFAEDTKDKMTDTLLFWNDIVKNKYDVFVSTTTISEIQACSDPKRTKMEKELRKINFVVINETVEVESLANEYINNNVLSKNNYDDCVHIASAVISGCDLIISWNFKHLVNFKTIKNVNIVNTINNYNEISIITPTMMVETGDYDE